MVLGGLIVDAGGVLLRNGPMTARRRWEAENGRPVGFLDQALRQAVGAGWQGGRGEEEIRRRLTRYTGIAPGELAGLLQVLTAHERLDTVLADYLLGAAGAGHCGAGQRRPAPPGGAGVTLWPGCGGGPDRRLGRGGCRQT